MIGIVIAKRDADPIAVIARVKQAIEEHRDHLPRRARLDVLYDRSELAGRVEHTLVRALAEEVAVVALVVLLFLLHAAQRAGPAADAAARGAADVRGACGCSACRRRS